MEWFTYAAWPAVWFFETSVALIVKWGEKRWKPEENAAPSEAHLHELRAVAALARASRLIGWREEGIIVNAARLSRTPVRAIALPAEFVRMLDADAVLTEALVAAHQDMHTRFPVTEQPGDPQGIVGYVNFKDVVATLRLNPHEPSLRSVLRPLTAFAAETSVAECLERMIREHTHIALVREADGRVTGMLTLEDVLEELVGEIHDEYDRLPAHLVSAGTGWFVGGGVGLDRIRQTTGLDLPPKGDHPVLTLNDWVLERLGQPPRGGEQIDTATARVLVRKTRRKLVQEAHLSRREPNPSVPQHPSEPET
jgi:putative hemolysin